MLKANRNRQKFVSQIPSSIYLAIAVLIFAASSSVTRKIVEIGQTNLIDGRNPISLCNVLFVGNLCALAFMIIIFHPDWKLKKLKAISRKNWILLTITGILSGAIATALIFTALGQTNITNIVLIGRIEPILTLLLSFLLFGSQVNLWTMTGSIVSLAGVAATIFFGSSGQMMNLGEYQFGFGEICVAIAAIINSISSVIGKQQL